MWKPRNVWLIIDRWNWTTVKLSYDLTRFFRGAYVVCKCRSKLWLANVSTLCLMVMWLLLLQKHCRHDTLTWKYTKRMKYQAEWNYSDFNITRQEDIVKILTEAFDILEHPGEFSAPVARTKTSLRIVLFSTLVLIWYEIWGYFSEKPQVIFTTL